MIIPLFLVYYQEHRTFKINSYRDFLKIRCNLDGKYIITKDLDFKYKVTKSKDLCDKKTIFDGELNGNNYVIKNIGEPLLSCLGKNAKVENLKLTSVEIDKNGENLGALAYFNHGSIKNIYDEGRVEGQINVGGTVGFNTGFIEHTVFKGTVRGIKNIGGIVGFNMLGVINQARVTGKIEGEIYVGGLAGQLNATTTYLFMNNLLEVNVYGVAQVGGVTGSSGGFIKNNIIVGEISGYKFVGILCASSNCLSQNNLFLGCIIGYDQDYYKPVYVINDDVFHNIIPEEYHNYLITETEISNPDWYINVLDLDPEIWDLETIKQKGYPTLKK